MPYRDLTPRPMTPHPMSPLPHPLWEKLYLWAFVALSPWLVPAMTLKDAHDHLRLATHPSPLDAEGRDALLTRLAGEAPTRVTCFVRVVHTIASGAEDVWHVLVVRFRDGTERVVASYVGPPAVDHVARVLHAIRPHRDLRSVIDDETLLGLPGLAIVLSFLPIAVWALALTILVAPLASLLVIAPLPIALGLHAIATRCAIHVIPHEE